MASVTQDLRFKQAVIVCAQRKGVTCAARKYKTTRQWIYYWLSKKIRWNDRLVEETIQKTAQPSKPTHSGRTDTHSQYEKKESRYRVGGLLGEVKR